MHTLTAHAIDELFDYAAFLPWMTEFLQKAGEMPVRTHHQYGQNTLLLMPAWNDRYCGVKVATVAPGNPSLGLPSVQATYLLLDAPTGRPLYLMDGLRLTVLRTAAASALAASLLARPDAHTLLVMGAGRLCPALIEAHATVRPLERVFIWNRHPDRIHQLLAENDFGRLQVEVCEDAASAASEADVISCATASPTPILRGDWVTPGTHIDLVGSYRSDMREADDELMRRATIWLDNPAARHESGDIALPLQHGALTADRILGTLQDLLLGTCPSRTSPEQITVFKSVGFALEDLALASWLAHQVEAST